MVRLPPALARFAEGLVIESEKEVLEFVRGYLGKKLEPLTAPLLVDGVINRRPLILSDEQREKFGRTMRRVLRNPAARKVWEREKGKVNEDLLIAWWKEDRPDLYGVVINWPDKAEMRQYIHDEMERVKSELSLNQV
jgi:hypothetical protein